MIRHDASSLLVHKLWIINLFFLEHNPELLYNILHQRVILARLRGKSGFADYVDNIELVIGFFSGHLKLNDEEAPILSLETIQTVIQNSVRQLPISKLR